MNSWGRAREVEKSKPKGDAPVPTEKKPKVKEEELKAVRQAFMRLRDKADESEAGLIADVEALVFNLLGGGLPPQRVPPTRTPMDTTREAVATFQGGQRGGKSEELAQRGNGAPADIDHLYEELRRRLFEDPRNDAMMLRILQVRPELEVRVERKELVADGTSLRGRVAVLMAAGWFTEPTTFSATRKELMRTGAEPNGGNLSRELNNLVRDGFLTDEGKDGYRIAPGAVVRRVER